MIYYNKYGKERSQYGNEVQNLNNEYYKGMRHNYTIIIINWSIIGFRISKRRLSDSFKNSSDYH